MKTAWVVCVALSLCPGGASAFELDWPVPYQNERLTRALDGTGALIQPALKWSRRLGGKNPPVLVQDLDGTGPKLVELSTGRVQCWSAESGVMHWSTPLIGADAFRLDRAGRAADLDGDGDVDLVVSRSGANGALWIVDSTTGAVQWELSGLGPKAGINGISHQLADIDGDDALELVVHLSQTDGGPRIFVYDFGQGFGDDALVYIIDDLLFIQNFGLAVFDATGDGQAELLVTHSSRLNIYRAATGQLLFASGPGWYGDIVHPPLGAPVVPVEIDGFKGSELFYVDRNHLSAGHFGVASMDALGTPTVKWQIKPPSSLRVLPPVDLDGDGKDEIVASVFGDEGDNRWRTRVYESATGLPLVELVDQVAVGLADVDGDGSSEVVVASSKQAAVPPHSKIQVARWDGDITLEVLWDDPITDAALAGVADRDGDGADEVFLYRDLSPVDGRRDTLQVISNGAVQASWEFPKFHEIVYRGVSDHLVGTEKGQVLVYSKDGHLDVLSTPLNPVGKRIRTGGFLPEVLVGALKEGGAPRAVVSDSVGRVMAVAVAEGTVVDSPGVNTLLEADFRPRVLAMIDVDGDGARELLVEDYENNTRRYRLFDQQQNALWSLELEGQTGTLDLGGVGLGGDINGDGVRDFYVHVTSLKGQRTGSAVDGATGEVLWQYLPYQAGGVGAMYSPPLFADVNDDGNDDVIVDYYHDRPGGALGVASDPHTPVRALDGVTGATLWTLPMLTGPGRHALAELDGDPSTLEIIKTWWTGRAAYSVSDGAAALLWTASTGGPDTRGMPLMIDIDGDGGEDLVHHDHTNGTLRANRGLDGAALWVGEAPYVAGERRLFDGRIWRRMADGSGYEDGDGELVEGIGSLTLNERALAVSDLTGLGHPTAVFSGIDGRLYAVNLADGTLDWVFDVGFAVGHLAAADLDGDALVELLFSAGDGYLYALGPAAPVGTVAEVRDGTGADVDKVLSFGDGITTSSFSANWDAPAGGTEPVAGYFVRLLTSNGGLVVDWMDAGGETQVTGLYAPLAPGVTYRVVVKPYGADGSGNSTVSDGFSFLDDDGDGLINDVESALGTDPTKADTDGDGLSDSLESDGGKFVDTDGDGTQDALDEDSDGDGVLDSVEGAVDTDGDGVADFQDTDDDGDTIPTVEEQAAFSKDVDGDGVMNWLDTNSDGDALLDAEEGTGDVDGDGIANYLDADDGNDPASTPTVEDPIVTAKGEHGVEEAAGCQAGPGHGAPRGPWFLLAGLWILVSARRVRRDACVLPN